jgi:hypothetical protein
MWSSGEEANLCIFLSFVYLCIAVGDPLIKRVEIPLTALTPTHYFACPTQRPRFPTSYVVVFFVLRDKVSGDCSFC